MRLLSVFFTVSIQSFETTFEKRVPELGGDARFSSQSVISALPFYLTVRRLTMSMRVCCVIGLNISLMQVQFVRFDWKKGNNKKAKIMRVPSRFRLLSFSAAFLMSVFPESGVPVGARRSRVLRR